jgi:hypothetical protein
MTLPAAPRRGVLTILSLLAAAIVLPNPARAAGGAYQVDTAEVSDAGACKVESWASWAANRDFVGAVSPSCAMNVGLPLELSTQIARSSADGEWATSLTPKAKLNLRPSGIGSFGFALTSNASFDLLTRENTSFAVTLPATVRLSENMRINLNGGWLLDRTVDRSYVTYGLGFDLRTSDNIWTLTAEAFGLAGVSDTPGVVQPRFQIGLRYRPVDRFSIDLIYGRNLTGENADWLTLATIIRFPPDK